MADSLIIFKEGEKAKATQNNIYKRIKEIDKMNQNGYKRMLKHSDSAENELWNQAYRELKAEKEQLLEKLASINKAMMNFTNNLI